MSADKYPSIFSGQMEAIVYIYFFTCIAYEVCKRRIIGLNACLPGIPQHFTDNERDIHMSSLVPFDNISMVKSTNFYFLYSKITV